jgi:hypothetical protein
MKKIDRTELLHQLDAQHEALLVELDELADKIEQALTDAGFATPAAAANAQAPRMQADPPRPARPAARRRKSTPSIKMA